MNTENQMTLESFRKSRHVRNLFLMTVIGAVLGLLGPFGMANIPFYISIPYWITTCYLGYAIYAPLIFYSEKKLENVLVKRWHRIGLGAFMAGVLMTFVAPLMAWMYFDVKVNILEEFTAMFPRTLLIGTVITVISLLQGRLENQSSALKDTQNELEETKKDKQTIFDAAYQEFMSQLPIQKRGELLCMEMDDHYIRVYTTFGHHMVLMRFKDALSLLANYPGFQTHRSWWVAYCAISSVEREDRKLRLRLSNDLVVPVSRTFVKQVREAGFA